MLLASGADLLFTANAQAVKCVGNAYDVLLPATVPGLPAQCGGELLGWGVEEGPGVSPCLAPVNATCAVVAEQVNGANCSVNFYLGGATCEPASQVATLNCGLAGASYGGAFDHFDIACF